MSSQHLAVVVNQAPPLITTFQAIVLGVLQGVSELFPVSSLGHTVLFPHLFGWTNIVKWQSQPESPWLAFIVMLHVGSAVGLLIYFWRDWVAIIKAFFHTLRTRKVETPDERLAWLIIVASIPVGILGIAFEHKLRVATATPEVAAIFLIINGFILLGAERLRKTSEVRELARREGLNVDGGRRLETLDYREAAVVGVGQSTALIAGISRDGVVMATGLAPRARQQRRGTVRIPPGDADHPGRRAVQAPRSDRFKRQRRARPGGDRRDRRRDHGRNHRPLPDALFQARHAGPVRHLLPRVRGGDGDLQRLSAG